MDIEELSKKIDKYYEVSKKREEKGRYENLGYIAWGFSLALIGLSITGARPMDNITYGLFAVVCFIVGSIHFRKSNNIKVE